MDTYRVAYQLKKGLGLICQVTVEARSPRHAIELAKERTAEQAHALGGYLYVTVLLLNAGS